MTTPSNPIQYYFQDKRISDVVSALNEKQSLLHLKGLVGSSAAFIIRAVAEQKKGIHLIILSEKEEAAYLLNDLQALSSSVSSGKMESAKIFFFPSSFRKPFQIDDTDTSNIQLRAEVLNAIKKENKTLFIVSYAEAITEKVISKQQLEKSSLELKRGEKISISFLSDLLFEYGFLRSDFVIEPGQFSVRGGIVDIFSFANDNPYRIEFSGDDVASIRTFDSINQLSLHHQESASILPDIQKKIHLDESSSIIDYIIDNTKDNSINLNLWIRDAHLVFKNIISTEKIFLSPEEIIQQCLKFPLIEFGNSSYFPAPEIHSFHFYPQPSFNKNFELLIKTLEQQAAEGYKNIIFSDNPKQIERLYAIFESISGEDKILPFTGDSGCIIHEGFIDHDLKLSCYTDHQIFERYHRYKLSSSGFKKDEAITLKEFKAMNPGDYVTHIDYGIGRFGGLEKIEINGKQQESIRLVYKDNDVLYISIHALHQISKYSGKEGGVPQLDKLGSNTWTNLKQKTKKKVKEIAFNLIKLYAQRKKQKGFAFLPDTYLQNELEASFIYEDTPDQIKSTADVKRDMESETPMDRLICGDVGFGKTEIAIRAAFKAVNDSKQVAVLVPTTILAIQHYKTFSDRMKELPCSVDYINRFKSSKQQKESLKNLAEGKTDIIIGTHLLLGKDVKFKDIGLMIVDEEQKFGVSAKDKLKTIKTNVDTLTLTATPIPRTLQFSMMGARDMSIINTPPPNRYPIHTECHSFNEKIISETIEYEISRGGQIFFVHNRVQNIERYAELIRRICLKARVIVAHGQMKSKTLEKSMMDFIEGEFDVLVCTTIIESGLDIPNANTIFINDAQNFGLSDLYQLRGRVGRSNKKAFCYLLTPPIHTLTSEARKRLRAIEEFSDLGSGFHIAMRDLDIRGAGNLLGAEQSGFITEIG
ncbi:MAG: transcription-repair coupling factor [Bacteroidota bacterium]